MRTQPIWHTVERYHVDPIDPAKTVQFSVTFSREGVPHVRGYLKTEGVSPVTISMDDLPSIDHLASDQSAKTRETILSLLRYRPFVLLDNQLTFIPDPSTIFQEIKTDLENGTAPLDDNNLLSNLHVYKTHGNNYYSSGNLPAALWCYRHFLAFSRQISKIEQDRSYEACAYMDLGIASAALNEYCEAVHFYICSRDLFRELGDIASENEVVTNLGIVYMFQGDWENGLSTFEESLELCEKMGDKVGKGQTLNNIGNVYCDLSKPQNAIPYYEKAFEIFRDIESESGQAACLTNLGNAYRQQGKEPTATCLYERSLGWDS